MASRLIERAMRMAIDLAAPARPHPNPRVGAVILAGDEVVGTGAHQQPGEPHAEVLALRAAGARAVGGTAVVTLEPCNHQGRTGSCTAALAAAGIARVVIGAVDPDPQVDGSGIAALQNAGIEVSSGVLTAECEALDPGYFHHRRTGRPLVTMKTAATLDGQTAAVDRTSRWITSEEARADGHRLRSVSDVVVVGAGTVISDDPSLDVRLPGFVGAQPRPVVVAGTRPLPGAARIWKHHPLVYTPHEIELPVEQVVLPAGDRVDLTAVMNDLAARGHLSVMVEGGATLAAALLAGGHIDRIVAYLGAKLAGGAGIGVFAGSFGTMAAAIGLTVVAVDRVGPDIRVEAVVLRED